MNNNVKIAKELVRIAKELVGARIVPTHALFEPDDIKKIQAFCEENGLTVEFNTNGTGMTAEFSNGRVLSVGVEGDGIVYGVDGQDGIDYDYDTLENAIGALLAD